MNIVLFAGLAAVALAFLMVGHYPPWLAFEQQWMAGAGGVLVGAAALRTCQRRVDVPAIAVLSAALATVPLIQYAAGQVWFRSDAVVSATYLLGFATSIVAARALARREPIFVPSLMSALLCAAIVSTGIALAQWQQLDWPQIYVVALKQGGRPYANLAQPNHLATLIALGLMAAL